MSSSRVPSAGGVVVVPSGDGAVGNGILPSNKSNQTLVNEDYLDNAASRGSHSSSTSNISQRAVQAETMSNRRNNPKITASQWVTVFVLCYVNLINYMDRFTLAGILNQVQEHYSINDSEAGLLQTVFVISYMIFAPLFGYLGDRHSRRWIMVVGVFLWSLTTLLGSFTQKNFGLFILSRALVGVGEASYSTIAPTILSDMFTHDRRSKMLALFYFAIPVGSGLGYIVGSETSKLLGNWEWALRVTPVMGTIAVFLIIFCMVDPPRGESEGNTELKPTTYKEDLKGLAKNKSFMLSSLGFTCVTFVAGALAWWGPKFVMYGLKIQSGVDADVSLVAFKFGVVTMVSGIIGVPLGSIAAQKLRVRNPRADPLICAFGLLASTPLMFAAAIMAQYNTSACFVLIFFAELFLNLNWSIVADILLYVVIPTRRSTAEAFQILLSHAFGDAGSPYLVGTISDCLKGVLSYPNVSADLVESSFNTTAVISSNITAEALTAAATTNNDIDDPVVAFKSLQYALFTTCFVEVLGGIFFLLNACYIVGDKNKCDRIVASAAGGQLMPDEASSSQTEDEDEFRPVGRITFP